MASDALDLDDKFNLQVDIDGNNRQPSDQVMRLPRISASAPSIHSNIATARLQLEVPRS